jgi:adenine/guanine phosphoribosyltransferase-like PRPP-binding protein
MMVKKKITINPKKETYNMSFSEFEKRCKDIAKVIKSNPDIKNIYGVPRGGMIPAARIAYLLDMPITFSPHMKETAIIDDCLDSGATRHSFGNFQYFFVLIDKQFEGIDEWIKFWWDKK